MGFIMRNNETGPIVTLEDNSVAGVFVRVGDTRIIEIHEDGTLELCNYVDADEVGNLKLTEGKDDGWGGYVGHRACVFFNNKELVLPAELKKAAPKTKRSKKTSKVIE